MIGATPLRTPVVPCRAVVVSRPRCGAARRTLRARTRGGASVSRRWFRYKGKPCAFWATPLCSPVAPRQPRRCLSCRHTAARCIVRRARGRGAALSASRRWRLRGESGARRPLAGQWRRVSHGGACLVATRLCRVLYVMRAGAGRRSLRRGARVLFDAGGAPLFAGGAASATAVSVSAIHGCMACRTLFARAQGGAPCVAAPAFCLMRATPLGSPVAPRQPQRCMSCRHTAMWRVVRCARGRGAALPASRCSLFV